MSASLMPMPRLQFFDSNGQPLSGGLLYSYAAGTSTPLATYTDATATTPAPNPIVLDAAGSASVWLGASQYRFVLENSAGVQIWAEDLVSSVSLPQLTGNSTVSGLTVSGSLSAVNANVTSGVTAGYLVVNGAAAVSGALTASANATVVGNLTVDGALSVDGASSLAATTVVGGATIDVLNIGNAGSSQTLAELIAAAIPAVTAVAGTLIMTGVTNSGNWVIFTFGATAGTRFQLAFGAGNAIASGSSITLPAGFTSGNFVGMVSLNTINDSGSNSLDGFTAALAGLTITATGKDNAGHSYTGTANWIGVCWAVNV